MLQNIRKVSKGWVSWVIVIAISIPFALWGIERFNTNDQAGDDVWAYIGEHEITYNEFYQELQTYNQRLRERYGENFDRIDQERVRQSVLQFMFGRGVVFADAKAHGMVISDNQVKHYITENKNFQKEEDGEFDANKYVEYLSASNITASVFENEIREAELYNQYIQGFWESNFLTPYELKTLYQLLNHKRKLAYVILPWEQRKNVVEVTDDEVLLRYEENKNRFSVPEKLRVAYVSVSVSSLTEKVTYSEEDLETFYQQHEADFSSPEERRIRHILFAQTDKKLAEEIYHKLLTGGDFVSLAKLHSMDTLSAKKGGDLGMIGRGTMVEDFEDVAFMTQENQIKLVQTEFGHHIIEVMEIKPSRLPPFAEVRKEVLESYQLEQANNTFYSLQEELSNLAFDHADSLQVIEEKLKLPIQQSDWFGRAVGNSSDTLTQYEAIREAAFSPQVKNEGLNSSVIDIEGQQVVVLRLMDKQAAYIKSLDKVKNVLADEMIQAKALAKLTDDINKEMASLRSNTLQWTDFINKYDITGDSQTTLTWVSNEGADGNAFAERGDIYRLAFESPRVRSRDDNNPPRTFLNANTSLNNVAVVYMTDSTDVAITDEELKEGSEIWTVMNDFQNANIRNATLEVLQVRYPIPRVDVSDRNIR